MTNEQVHVTKQGGFAALLKGVKPAVPATVGAFVLTFLFAAMMPISWIAAICWNLYLDSLHQIFAPPLGNAARLGVALGFALIAALIAMAIALVLIKPAGRGRGAASRRAAASADDEASLLRRRRVDVHPDAPAVAPIRAGRDLPVGGLGPLVQGGDPEPLDLDATTMLPADDADLEPLELGAAQQYVEPIDRVPDPVVPDPVLDALDPADDSLGAMVARFEQGLGRRRRAADVGGQAVQQRANVAVPQFAPANEDGNPPVDLALEAALATLQRMNKAAIG